ncbi:MAG: hypothetical protein D6730_06005 [Bacteroidetes bacterium]|nr:MAG: hypothetical protein D6730_06005 [Bacteroidota bacterium]
MLWANRLPVGQAAIEHRFFHGLEAEKAEGHCLIRWQLPEGMPAEGFRLQRSFNGTDFVPITAIQQASGTYKDTEEQMGNSSMPVVFYRLSKPGQAGEHIYSNIVSVRLGLKSSRLPTPFRMD